MNFLVHMSFPVFFKSLAAGSTVYVMAYSEGGEKGEGFVLLTSESGVVGGNVHALQMLISGEPEVPLDRAVAASDKVQEFLKAKGLILHKGVLLTAGLHEALRYWGKVTKYSVDDLDKILKPKKGVKTK